MTEGSDTPMLDKLFDQISNREVSDGSTPSKWSYEAILDLTDFARTLERALSAKDAELAAMRKDAARWREISQHFVHERCGPNIGWTIGDLVLQGDTPEEAVDSAIDAAIAKEGEA